MDVVAIIQARLGSTRLPGKTMYPLDTQPVVSHVIDRTLSSSILDRIVLATSSLGHDDLLANQGLDAGVTVSRGSESDVLKRTYIAASEADADIVVRVCADNPLISPDCITVAAETVINQDIDYAGYAIKERTLPLGITAEAFTMASYEVLESRTESEYEREHVTIGYKEDPSTYSVRHLNAADTFDEAGLFRRPQLRLTLDTPLDYELLRRVYANVSAKTGRTIDLRDAITFIDTHGLETLNTAVEQQSPTNDE